MKVCEAYSSDGHMFYGLFIDSDEASFHRLLVHPHLAANSMHQ